MKPGDTPNPDLVLGTQNPRFFPFFTPFFPFFPFFPRTFPQPVPTNPNKTRTFPKKLLSPTPSSKQFGVWGVPKFGVSPSSSGLGVSPS
jgi:hypothetical protein